MAPRVKPPTLAEQQAELQAALGVVVSGFPGAVVDKISEVDPKAERCDGIVSGQTGRIPCGNNAQWPGSLCAGPCRPEGRGQIAP